MFPRCLPRGLSTAILLLLALGCSSEPQPTEAELKVVAEQQSNSRQLGERALERGNTWLAGGSNEDFSVILESLDDARKKMASTGLAESEFEPVVTAIEQVKSCSTLQQQLTEQIQQFRANASLEDLDRLLKSLQPIQNSPFRRLQIAAKEFQETLILAKDNEKAAATLAAVSDDEFARLAQQQKPPGDVALRTLAEFYARSRNIPQEIDRRAAEKLRQRDSLREAHWNESRLAPYVVSSATQCVGLPNSQFDGAAVLARNLRDLPVTVVAAKDTDDQLLRELGRIGLLKGGTTNTSLSVVIPPQLGQQIIQAISTIDTDSGGNEVTDGKTPPFLEAVCAKHKINKLFAAAIHPPRAREHFLWASSATYQFAVAGRLTCEAVQPGGPVHGTIAASRVFVFGPPDSSPFSQALESQGTNKFCRPCFVVSAETAFLGAVCEFPETEGLRRIVNRLDTSGVCPLLPSPAALQNARPALPPSRYAATLSSGSKNEIEQQNNAICAQLARLVFSPKSVQADIRDIVMNDGSVTAKYNNKTADLKRAVTAISAGFPTQSCVELNHFFTAQGDRFDSFTKILYLNERCTVVRERFPEAFQVFDTWRNSEAVFPIMTEDGPALLSGQEAFGLMTRITDLGDLTGKSGKEDIAQIASLRKEVLDWTPRAYRPPDPPYPVPPGSLLREAEEVYGEAIELAINRLDGDEVVRLRRELARARRVLAPTKEEVEQYEREVAEWNRVVAAIQAQWERDQVQVVDAWPRRKELMLTLLDEIAASRGALRNRLSRARFSLKHHIEDETKPLNTWSGTADKKTNLGNAEPVPVFLIEEGNIQSGAVPNRR